METLEETKLHTKQKKQDSRGLKGVHFDKNKKLFVAHINFKGTLMYLGNFLDKYEDMMLLKRLQGNILKNMDMLRFHHVKQRE